MAAAGIRRDIHQVFAQHRTRSCSPYLDISSLICTTRGKCPTLQQATRQVFHLLYKTLLSLVSGYAPVPPHPPAVAHLTSVRQAHSIPSWLASLPSLLLVTIYAQTSVPHHLLTARHHYPSAIIPHSSTLLPNLVVAWAPPYAASSLLTRRHIFG